MEAAAVVTHPAVRAAVGWRRVAVIAPSAPEARAEFDRVARAHPDLDMSRRLGQVMLPDGGLITFDSVRSLDALRGLALDVVLVTDPEILTVEFVDLMRPHLATTLNPVVGVLL